MARSHTGRGRPRAWIVDLDHWDSFMQWGASIPRHGWQVHRLANQRVTGRQRLRSGVDLLVLGAAIHQLPIGTDLLCPTTIALVEAAQNVQATEEIMAVLQGAGLLPPGTVMGRVPDVARQRILYDKWLMTEFARERGLQTPESWLEPPVGLVPLVVQGRIGLGGKSVRIIRDSSDLSIPITAGLPRISGGFFVQEFMHGEVVTAVGVSDKGRLIVHATYHAIAPEEDELGPPEILRVGHFPSIAEEMEALVSHLEYSGVFAIDYIQAPDGRIGMLDFSPRIFAGPLQLRRAGVDLLGAYLSLFGDAKEPTQASLASGLTMDDRLLPSESAPSWSRLQAEMLRSTRATARTMPVTGPGHAALTALRAAVRSASVARRLVGSTGGPPEQVPPGRASVQDG